MSTAEAHSQFSSTAKKDMLLSRARFEALSKQIPMLYALLITNTAGLAYTYSGLGPKSLSLYLPLVICTICLGRLFVWWQARTRVYSDAEIAIRLRTLVFLTGALCSCINVWALCLFNYGGPYEQCHSAFYLSITVLGCYMCLTHSPGSLAMLALTGIVPFSIFFMTLGNQVLFVIAINMLIVSAAIAVVVFGYSRDFSERVHVQQNLIDRQAETQRLSQDNDRLANIDSLTGLPNRRSFLKQLEDGLTTARHGSQKLAVGLIDLDGFKPVNDVYGHAYGDQLLNLVGQRLRRCHGERVSFARLGGDEFGILFRDPSGVEDVVNCGRSISEALRCPFDLSPIRIQISGSVGFAVFPDAAQSPEKLFEKADYALYHAKNSARGSVVLFSEEHERAIAREGLIVQNLMSADLETELSLAFQPIIDTRTGQPLGFEALARWESPLLGNVPPSVFVELAERHNMINQLTLVLLRKALCAAREWPDNFFVSFNLSAFDLASPAAMVKILETIRGAGFPASRIDFEITETAVVVDFEQARRAIIALRELGARIALDDFGCGYSSLAYVQKLPIDRIKIDRSFVSEIEKDPASQKIVRTIVVLCRNLEIDCVAEGVETDGQLKALQSADCHNVQGYLFAKPMPSREISPYLMNQLATKIKPITSGKAAAA